MCLQLQSRNTGPVRSGAAWCAALISASAALFSLMPAEVAVQGDPVILPGPSDVRPVKKDKNASGSKASSHAIGKHVEIVCDFDDQALCDAALAISEAGWAETVRLFSMADTVPEKPVTFHLYATVKAYEKAEKKLTKGKFRENLAFSAHKDLSSHLVVQPPMSAAVRKKVGLTEMTRRLVAHEASHLCRYVCLPNHEDHPRWLADGVAWMVEQKVAVKQEGGKPQSSPYADKLVLTAQRLLKDGKYPAIADVLKDNFGEAEGFDIYAVTHLTFEFLASRGDGAWLKTTLGSARSMGGGGHYAERLRDVAMETLGSAAAGVDAALRAHLLSLKPEWDQVIRSLDVDGEDWTQVAFPDRNAIAWRKQSLTNDNVFRGTLSFLSTKPAQMNLLLGRSDDGFYSIAFVQGFGYTLFRYHAKSNEWEKLASVEVDALKKRKAVKFRVDAFASKINVYVLDHMHSSTKLPEPLAKGEWGVGAQAGSAGRWKRLDVRITPIGVKR